MLSLLMPWVRIDPNALLPLMTASLFVSAAVTGWMAARMRPVRPPTLVELDAVHRLIDRAKVEVKESARRGRPDPEALTRLQSLQALLPEDDLRRH
jgi:hypothetical protein